MLANRTHFANKVNQVRGELAGVPQETIDQFKKEYPMSEIKGKRGKYNQMRKDGTLELRD